MEFAEILNKVDHTLLGQVASKEEIIGLLNDGIRYNVASCCIPPYYVAMAKEYVGDKLKVCTVIGFPNGYNTTDTKVFETKKAIDDGADEIDMVINVAALKNKDFEYVSNEIKAVKQACGSKVLKVIIETCLLNEEEKVKMCHIVNESGADYIKTSTGFGGGGATFSDIALFKKHVDEKIGIKASGGISSFEDGLKFIETGATRLGTSRLVKIAKEMGL